MKIIVAGLILFFNGFAETLHAQVDPHFSQFYAYPLWLNPGMTGAMDGDYRVTALYRSQWSDVMTPFSTQGFSADVTTNKNLDIGASFLNQTAGDAGYQYLNAYLTLAYSGVRFGKDKTQQLRFGIQGGLLSRRFDRDKFQFGDQWNPVTGYNPGATTADDITKTSSSVFDLGAGVSYTDGSPDKPVNFFGGVAAFHLTRPQDPFVNASVKKFLPVRYTLHAGARIHVNDQFSVIPNALYLQQGSASEKMLGVFGQLQANDFTDLLFGVNYRFEDAVAPFAGVAFRNFVVGLSYDVNVSELGKAVSGTNSVEISLTYIGQRSGKPLKYLSCPRF